MGVREVRMPWDEEAQKQLEGLIKGFNQRNNTGKQWTEDDLPVILKTALKHFYEHMKVGASIIPERKDSTQHE